MKKILFVSCSLVLCMALIVSLAPAKNVVTDKTAGLRPMQALEGGDRLSDSDIEGFAASASASTTFLASFTFDAPSGACDTQSWTTVDITVQSADYWHVDSSADGLTGGVYGNLIPVRGTQSLWCGAVPTPAPNLILCGYLALPGYGNDWNQSWCNKVCLTVSGDVKIDFITFWDSEPGYDATTMEYDDGCTGAWAETSAHPGSPAGHFDGAFVDSTHSETILAANHTGSLRVRFHFQADGAWSDQDGLWDTDGAILIDSLSVSDGTGIKLAVEDFENAGGSPDASGATSTLDWISCNDIGYGDFSSLLPGTGIVAQEDPCFLNLTCMWTFYSNPGPDPAVLFYTCGSPSWPSQRAMPKFNSRDQYLSNEIWSPQITLSGTGSVFDFSLNSYRDAPLDNLQFYVWHVRSYVGASTCPGAWKDRNFVYYGGQKDWILQTNTFGDLLQTGVTKIQVAFGVVDGCGFWCGINGTGSCHSHAPLLDNVRVYRVDTGGPQWSVRDLDLFQDTFPGDGTTTGPARIDQANDILIGSNGNIRPGDSSVVQVNDPANGIATDTYLGGRPAIYMYMSVWPQGQPDISGTTIGGSGGPAVAIPGGRFPVVDSLTIVGNKWYCILMDSVFTGAVFRTGNVKDRYCVDVNDNLFAGGDTICFFFCATSVGGAKSYWSGSSGTVATLGEAAANPEEVQVLPAQGVTVGGDILYVEGMNFRGAQPYFDTAFASLGILGKVDRYDVRSPSSSLSNRPDSRISNRLVQLIPVYRKIIWNTGDLTNTLGDGGTANGGTTPDKTKDYAMLVDFLNLNPNDCGVYLNGDDVGEQWAIATGGAITLKSWCQHTLGSGSARGAGYGITPLGVGSVGAGLAFGDAGAGHATGPDTLVVFGGCNLINDFDILVPSGTAATQMEYRGNSLAGAAVIGQKGPNANSKTAAFLLSGFSFHYIRNANPGHPTGVPARTHHMADILTWLGNTVASPTGVKPVGNVSSLSQNYPNPFNPQTTIAFTVKDQTRVSLKIYNVAGQLVRTLVNDVRTPGVTHTIEWNGRNNAGASVSSGVYFYKLVSKDFTQTKKMVLLK